MKTKAEIATQDYQGKFNCAQSTIAVFAEDYGLNLKDALRIGAGLGGGCHSAEICGAVSAGAAIIGLKHGHTEPNPEQYAICRAKTNEFVTKFKEANEGNVTCLKLMGLNITTPDGRAQALEQNLFSTRCKDLVASAVNILEELGY